MTKINKRLVLIEGKSASGKTCSLRNLKGNVLYFNCESGKEIPFKNSFMNVTVTDPVKSFNNDFVKVINNPDKCDTVIIDSLTYLMDMFENKYVYGSKNTMVAWNDYQQFFKTLMQQRVAAAPQSVIMTAHITDQLNDEGITESFIKLKGALNNIGIESWFSNVILAKKVPIGALEGYENPHLIITDEDRDLGYKYVFQTRITKDTTGTRIRSPLGMWSKEETFIDSDCQFVIDRYNEYYGETK